MGISVDQVISTCYGVIEQCFIITWNHSHDAFFRTVKQVTLLFLLSRCPFPSNADTSMLICFTALCFPQAPAALPSHKFDCDPSIQWDTVVYQPTDTLLRWLCLNMLRGRLWNGTLIVLEKTLSTCLPVQWPNFLKV